MANNSSSKHQKKLIRAASGVLATAVMLQAVSLPVFGEAIASREAADEALRAKLASYAEDFPDGAFEFEEASGSVKENGQDLRIRVVRKGDPAEAVSVDVKSMDITAQYGEDYTMYTKRTLRKVAANDEEVTVPTVQAVMEKAAEEDAPAEEEVSIEETPAETEADPGTEEEYEIIEAQSAAEDAETAEDASEPAEEKQSGGLRAYDVRIVMDAVHLIEFWLG